MDKICVVGLGYIGLPTAVMFASHGIQVHAVDNNVEVINKLRKKQLHIEEKGLDNLLIQVIEDKKLTISPTPRLADAFIISVPSPINDDKTANLTYVEEATKSIIPYLRKGNLVILESTVPPLTVERVVIPILQQTQLKIGQELFVAHTPERVIPGRILEELVHNDRIIGGINEESAKIAKELYRSFVKGNIHLTNATTAELVKVMENTYRDVNIAYANELAMICEQVNVNVWEAIQLANNHPRVNIHLPGPGVGGHCIAVDPWFLVELQPKLSKLVHLARDINDLMPLYTIKKVRKIFSDHQITSGKVAVLGLSFKADIDDIRESPSLEVIKLLEEFDIDYTAYDPYIKENIMSRQTQNLEEALEHADLVLILTDHQMFKHLDPHHFKTRLRSNLVYDTKNCIETKKWINTGFTVYQLGNSCIEKQELLIN
jgi:UDP-N-acetyl-D-mannosaminuronic acid dehydrogenase